VNRKAIVGLRSAAAAFMVIMPPGLHGYIIFQPGVPRSLSIAWGALALQLGIVAAMTAVGLALSSQSD
jgi:hypothetical protein